jgi:hypothetical protein
MLRTPIFWILLSISGALTAILGICQSERNERLAREAEYKKIFRPSRPEERVKSNFAEGLKHYRLP